MFEVESKSRAPTRKCTVSVSTCCSSGRTQLKREDCFFPTSASRGRLFSLGKGIAETLDQFIGVKQDVQSCIKSPRGFIVRKKHLLEGSSNPAFLLSIIFAILRPLICSHASNLTQLFLSLETRLCCPIFSAYFTAALNSSHQNRPLRVHSSHAERKSMA